MATTHIQLRNIFAKYWQSPPRQHKLIPPASLVLKDDPTTLFTSSGMQQLVPYLLGETHPLGKRLYNIQPCLRLQDIDEVGDNRHDTFFEMMGNWSLGDYFKEEQLEWCYKFFIEEVCLPKEKLYVSIFEGYKNISRDEESEKIWKKLGVPQNRIHAYGVDKNWWSRSGTPDQMPAGEIGGPDSEVFYEFNIPHNPKYGNHCHPNCPCGKFLEIGNSVFIQYKKDKDGSLKELPQKNVDYGGGLDRILAAINNESDIFKTELYWTIIEKLEQTSTSGKKYSNEINKKALRIIADHLKAATFLANESLQPSNKQQGYVMRRLIRRAIVKMMQLQIVPLEAFSKIVDSVVNIYKEIYFQQKNSYEIYPIIGSEINSFLKTQDKGLREFEKRKGDFSGKDAFDLYQTYGFPLEITEELLREKGIKINQQEFYDEFNKHKNLSRTASAGMFKGGLADKGEKTIKYHTATHLIHQALFDVLGGEIRQQGSNITAERLRFDFNCTHKPTDEQIKNIETIVNEKISQGLQVEFKIMPKDEALKIGARAFFKQKYPDMVKVFFIGDYSKEFCGGPHVKNTQEIGKIKIYKLEKIGSNLFRVYAK